MAVTAFFGALTSYTILFDTIKGIPRDVEEEAFIHTTADIFIRGIEVQPQTAEAETERKISL